MSTFEPSGFVSTTLCGAVASWLSNTSVNGLSAAVEMSGVSNFAGDVATTVTVSPAGAPLPDASGEPDAAGEPDAPAEASAEPDGATDGRGVAAGAGA